MFHCLPRGERNQHFSFVQNKSAKFWYSGGVSHVAVIMEPSVLFNLTVCHVRSVSCCCLYLFFRAFCATRVPHVARSRR